jgi:hypothetical protein
MNFSFPTASLLLVFTFLSRLFLTDEYLTQTGDLAQTLEVRDLQGGFAGFTGHLYRVEPSGRWTMARVFNEKTTVEHQGKLTKKQLAALAKELAKYDLLGLPPKEGKPTVNPRVVKIKFGDHQSELLWKPNQPLPNPDQDKKTSVVVRFSGILQAVKAALEKKR